MDNTAKIFRFTAGLFQLLFLLACAAISEYAPIVGRHLGRWAGRTIVAGRCARAWYEANARETVESIAALAMFSIRAFIAAQLGTHCPRIRAWITPYNFTAYAEGIDGVLPSTTLSELTIRQLKAIARDAGIRSYGSMTKFALITALAT
ncbi:Rho termination factor N-terminal domain-containing protein (plasmid) [Synechococcus elongatus PCC 11801]|uniref:Rho termination factor N-terminal domain-containing protein n=1 Tax=Synechococcus elongatus PCC 11801 TaxID=2219813 RepID=A0ACD5A2Z5_SYNEL